MIYAYPNPSAPVRQGDIFRNLPRTKLLLGEEDLPIILETTDKGLRELDWRQLAKTRDQVLASVLLRPVTGIVITQDCDAIRSEYITLCEVRPFADVEGKYRENTRLSGFVRIVTQHARVNQKWYYLPPDERIEFGRMAADFTAVFEVPRLMLEHHRETLRLGRLNDEVAWPHFRERVAEFFRRYPYNEWYPLTAEEVDMYDTPEFPVDRYPWQ